MNPSHPNHPNHRTHRTHRTPRLLKLIPLLLATGLLAGCLGDNDDGSPPRPVYTQQVIFGDSLSDSGSYAVGAIAAAQGGKFTVNSVPATPQLWNERIAADLGLPAPCAAQTGLEGDPALGLSAPIADHPGCTNYAQGGARVSNPIGPRNKAVEPEVGYLTVPVATQIGNHLARSGGQFSGNEIVFVFAGGNDFLWQSDTMTADIAANLRPQINADIASGACIPADEAALNCLSGAIDRTITRLAPTYLTAMQQAGQQLASLINEQILAKGARRVVVLNLPDASKTPSMHNRSATVQAVGANLAQTFNAQLSAGLANSLNDRVLLVDLFSRFNTWAANPTAYGFSNFTDTACNLTKPVPNLLASSILCTPANVIAGDISHYAFADGVHPTPYAHRQMADDILTQMSNRGWR